MGVESGSQAILDAMDKGITLDQVRGAVSRLRAAGIRVGFFLQFGYPGEGWPRDRDDAPDGPRPGARRDRHLRQLPLAGNAFSRAGAARLGEKRNWRESSDLDPLFPGPFRASSISAFAYGARGVPHAARLARRAIAGPRPAVAGAGACGRWAGWRSCRAGWPGGPDCGYAVWGCEPGADWRHPARRSCADVAGNARQQTLDRYTASHIFPERKGLTKMIRKFSSLAIWVVLGLAIALAPLACGGDSNSPTDGASQSDATTSSH